MRHRDRSGAGRGLSDAWIRRGASTNLACKAFCVIGLCGSAVLLLPSVIASNQVAAIALLSFSSFVSGVYTANVCAVTPELGGRCGGRQVGRKSRTGVGNLACIVSPVVTGFIVERTSRFYFAIVWVCVPLPVGACSYLLIIPKATPVP